MYEPERQAVQTRNIWAVGLEFGEPGAVVLGTTSLAHAIGHPYVAPLGMAYYQLAKSIIISAVEGFWVHARRKNIDEFTKMACKLTGLPEEELVKHFEASPAKAQLFREILTFAMDADNAEQLAALAGAAADAADTEVAAQLVEVQVFTRALEQIGPSHMMVLRALNDISVRSETTLAGGRAMPALTTEQLAAQLPDLEPVITSLTSGLQTLGLIDRGS